MKFQIECANAFRDWWADNLLAERHCDTLMKMAWGYIKTNMNTAVEDELSNDESVTVSYVKAWEELFIALNEYITDEWVTTEVIPTIKSLIDLKHKVAVRKHGVNLLIQAVLKYDEKSVLDYFKSLLLYWWHDLNWNIRYAICEGFPSIAKTLSKDNCMDIFYPELAEFLNDVEILVRLTAIEATLEIFDMLETEHIKDDFIPVVIQHLNLDIDETCNSRMSKVIGKITFNLLNFSEVTSELNDALLSYFKGLVEIDTLEIVQNVWFNLPGMYFIFNKGELDFAEILEKYVSHKDQAIRHLVAKSFHEIVGISGMDKAKALEFKDMFFTLLGDADPEIRKTMINNLDDIVMNFLSVMGEEEIEIAKAEDGSETESKRSEFIHELLSNLVQVGETIAIQNPFVAKPKAMGSKVQFPTNSSWWRMRLVFYEKLWCLFDVFPQDSLKQAFFEAARFDFLNGAEPLRKRWVVLLAKMIYSELFEEERQEMLTRLVDELEEGTFVQRRCLLEFYEGSIQVFSKRYWHKQCYKGFMKFAHDKIPVMRVKFSKWAQNIFTQNLTKNDTEFDFIDGVDALLEDIGKLQNFDQNQYLPFRWWCPRVRGSAKHNYHERLWQV